MPPTITHPSSLAGFTSHIKGFGGPSNPSELPSPQRSIRTFFRGKFSHKYDGDTIPSEVAPAIPGTLASPADFEEQSDRISNTSPTNPVVAFVLPQETIASPNDPDHSLSSSSRKGHLNERNDSFSRNSISLHLSSTSSHSQSGSHYIVTSARKKPCNMTTSPRKNERRLTLSLGLSPLSPVPRVPAPSPKIEEISRVMSSDASPIKPRTGDLQSPFVTTRFDMLPGLGVWRRASESSKFSAQNPSDFKPVYDSFNNYYTPPSSHEIGLTSASSIEDFAEPRSLPHTPRTSRSNRTGIELDRLPPVASPRFIHREPDHGKSVLKCATPRRKNRDPFLAKQQPFFTKVHDDPNLPFLLYTINDTPTDEAEYRWYELGGTPHSREASPSILSSLSARKCPRNSRPNNSSGEGSCSSDCDNLSPSTLDDGMDDLVKMIPYMLRNELASTKQAEARPRTIVPDQFDFQAILHLSARTEHIPRFQSSVS